MSLTHWNRALADVLLPEDVNAGRPVRLACDDQAVAVAARSLGIRVADPVAELVAALRAEGLVDDEHGMSGAVPGRLVAGEPPVFLASLAALVLAASRMVSDDSQTMRAYYVRLGELLHLPLRANWPPVPGVPQLSGRFADLAAWLSGPEAGRRGLLDLPDVTRYVDTPIHQTILRSGDRAQLGAFFQRAGRLIAAGWDPVHQLRRWGGRHHLSIPLQQILARDELWPALSAALRSAHRSWDGTHLDEQGRRVLPAELALHLLPGRVLLSVTVPALDTVSAATGPDGATVDLSEREPTEVPADWLIHAEAGPVQATIADGDRIRVLPGPIILFEITKLGPRAVASAVDEPVWVLTCNETVISGTEDARRYRAPLPPGWALLCDIKPEDLPEDLRDHAPEHEPLGIALTGGLRLADSVWLLDHPPQLVCELGEPAPISFDGSDRGYVEPGQALDLTELAHTPGVHTVFVADRELTVELAERGTRSGIGSLSIDTDPRRVHHGPRVDTDPDAIRVCGATVSPEDACAPWQPPLIVRYRAQVDVIDADGTVRTLAPPAAAAPWLAHVGLTPGDAWEIPDPANAVWICVDASAGRFVVCHRADEVPPTDEVLDVVELFAAAAVVDRTGGGATERWRRLIAAVEAGAPYAG